MSKFGFAIIMLRTPGRKGPAFGIMYPDCFLSCLDFDPALLIWGTFFTFFMYITYCDWGIAWNNADLLTVWSIGMNLLWTLNFFFSKKAFEIVVCTIASILSSADCIKAEYSCFQQSYPRFWPTDRGEEVVYGPLTIELEEELEQDGIISRTFRIKKVNTFRTIGDRELI